MPLANGKRKKVFPFWDRFNNQSSGKYIPAENKIRQNKNSKDFLLNTRQVFSIQNLETSQGNMEDKILGFQFKTVSAKRTRQSYKFHKLRHFV